MRVYFVRIPFFGLDITLEKMDEKLGVRQNEKHFDQKRVLGRQLPKREPPYTVIVFFVYVTT